LIVSLEKKTKTEERTLPVHETTSLNEASNSPVVVPSKRGIEKTTTTEKPKGDQVGTSNLPATSKRGFASMDPARQKEIASKGK
jgi:hypothetical protein